MDTIASIIFFITTVLIIKYKSSAKHKSTLLRMDLKTKLDDEVLKNEINNKPLSDLVSEQNKRKRDTGK